MVEWIGRVEISGRREAARLGPPRLDHQTRKLEAQPMWHRATCYIENYLLDHSRDHQQRVWGSGTPAPGPRCSR
jgi:hypothetical protein